MRYDEAELRRRMLKLRRNEYDKMILSLMHVIVRLEDVCRLSGSEGAVEEMAEADANGLLDVYRLLHGLTWKGVDYYRPALRKIDDALQGVGPEPETELRTDPADGARTGKQ